MKPLLLLASLLLPVVHEPDGPPGAAVGATEPTVVWIYSAQSSSDAVALGDGGSLAFSSGSSAGVLLFSSFANVPPQPVIQQQMLYGMEAVAAASDSDLFLTVSLEVVTPSSAVGWLHAFRSDSPEPIWSHFFPEQFWPLPTFDVSSDGTSVVTLFVNEPAGVLELRMHAPDTGAVTALHMLDAPLLSGASDLSSDGKVFAYSHSNGTGDARLYDPRTGALLFETPGTLPKRQGLSHDGQHVAARQSVVGEGWHVRVTSQLAGSATPLLDITSPNGEVPADFALSDDGSVLAVGWYQPALTPTLCRVEAWHVASGELLLARSFGGAASALDNPISDVALSADGRRLAVGIWGLGVLGPPELTVFDTSTDSELAAFPGSGTVFALDMSPDGQHVLAHRIGNHAEQGHTTSSMKLYDLGGDDLSLSGTPSLGSTLSFDLYGTPGASAWLLSSAGLLPVPLPVANAGNLLLDPNTMVLLPIGDVDGDGVLTRQLDLPSDGVLLGLKLFVQGATLGPKHMGHTALGFRLLP